MIDALRNTLEEYKKCTNRLIENLEKENFDILQSILNDRQGLIDTMDSMSYSCEEFKNIAENMSIVSLEEKLSKLMNEKKHHIKMELNRICVEKKANKSYNKKLYRNAAVFFNKRI